MAGKHGTLWCAIMGPLACWQTNASYYHIVVTPTMVMEVVMMLMAITITITIHPIGFHWWELSWENYLSVWLPAETALGWLVIFKSSQKLRRYFVAYIYLSSRICPLSFDICQVIIATPIGHFSWALKIPLIDEILCKQENSCLCLCLCLFVGQVMSPHQSDNMSQVLYGLVVF